MRAIIFVLLIAPLLAGCPTADPLILRSPVEINQILHPERNETWCRRLEFIPDSPAPGEERLIQSINRQYVQGWNRPLATEEFQSAIDSQCETNEAFCATTSWVITEYFASRNRERRLDIRKVNTNANGVLWTGRGRDVLYPQPWSSADQRRRPSSVTEFNIERICPLNTDPTKNACSEQIENTGGITYITDNQGRLITRKFFDTENGVNTEVTRETYEYPNPKEEVRRIFSGFDLNNHTEEQVTLYIDDARTTPRTVDTFSPTGEHLDHAVYRYSESGLLEAITYTNNANQTLSTLHQYDSDDRLIQTIERLSGQILTTTNYTYDPISGLLAQKWTDSTTTPPQRRGFSRILSSTTPRTITRQMEDSDSDPEIDKDFRYEYGNCLLTRTIF